MEAFGYWFGKTFVAPFVIAWVTLRALAKVFYWLVYPPAYARHERELERLDRIRNPHKYPPDLP